MCGRTKCFSRFSEIRNLNENCFAQVLYGRLSCEHIPKLSKPHRLLRQQAPPMMIKVKFTIAQKPADSYRCRMQMSVGHAGVAFGFSFSCSTIKTRMRAERKMTNWMQTSAWLLLRAPSSGHFTRSVRESFKNGINQEGEWQRRQRRGLQPAVRGIWVPSGRVEEAACNFFSRFDEARMLRVIECAAICVA